MKEFWKLLTQLKGIKYMLVSLREKIGISVRSRVSLSIFKDIKLSLFKHWTALLIHLFLGKSLPSLSIEVESPFQVGC